MSIQPQFTTQDLVGLAAGKNAADFQTAFNQLMLDRASAAAEAAREEIAKNLIAGQEEEEQNVDPAANTEE